MCDYSLMGVPNRLAKEGDELIVHTFPTGSKGLTSPSELVQPERKLSSSVWEAVKSLFHFGRMHTVTAVCIPPGARLILRDIPLDIQSWTHVRSVESVIFTQLDMAENMHRDAVRFDNGLEITLQHLADGQRVHVVSLGFDVVNDPDPANFDRLVRF